VIGVGGRGFGAHAAAIDKLKEEGMNVAVVAVCDAYRPRMLKPSSATKQRLHEIPGTALRSKRGYRHDRHTRSPARYQPSTPSGLERMFIAKSRSPTGGSSISPNAWRRSEEIGTRLSTRLAGMSDGAWSLMKKLVQDGQIGQPIHAECGYFRVGDWANAACLSTIPTAQPGLDLDWEAFLAIRPSAPTTSAAFSAGACTKTTRAARSPTFPSFLYPVLSILGVTFPSKVVATGGKFRYEEREIPDTFNMLADYPEKITVACLGTQGNNHAGTADAARQPHPHHPRLEGTLTIEGNDVVFTPAEGSQKEAQRFPSSTARTGWDIGKPLSIAARSAIPTRCPPPTWPIMSNRSSDGDVGLQRR
jgi:hypothetical protein